MPSKPTRSSKISKERKEQQQIPIVKVQKQNSAQEGRMRSRIKALGLLILAGAYSPISQLTLSPVYGSIPSSLYHHYLTTFSFLLAWALKSRIRGGLPHFVRLLPVLASAIPTVQFYLFQCSRQLGPVYGPLTTELLTYCPLVFGSVIGAAGLLDTFHLRQDGQHIIYAGLGLAAYVVLNVAETFSGSLIARNIGSSVIFTRSGLQFLVTACYTILLPSKFILFAMPSLLHTLYLNVHSPLPRPTGVLRNTLQNHQYSLVDRQESLTGYLSVLDNLKDGFRVMRCDHSLLGGEWVPPSPLSFSTLKEPVYSVFVILEAVRLVVSRSAGTRMHLSDDAKRALVVGLGVGTTPSALMAHGINTTVVELDPVVYQFAAKYFTLPPQLHVVIEDAIAFVEKSQAEGRNRSTYDYIVHDVFTGGAEPIALFTQEFLRGLSDMLTADGVIAINYAGDLLRPPARYVVQTIRSIFPACRLYREGPDPMDSASDAGEKPAMDFTNMVIFCRKSRDSFTFRKPVEADFLGTHARRNNLWPRHEINEARFDGSPRDRGTKILTRGCIKDVEKYQKQGATDHWELMRNVLPDAIWENW